MSAMLQALRAHAASRPESIAIDPIGEAPVTYAALVPLVETKAAAMRCQHGGQHGDPESAGTPVVIRMDHGLASAVLELALLHAGIPVLSLPAFFTPEQCHHAMMVSGAGAVPCLATGRSASSPLPRGTARITFTSGSTGTPKGVCLSASHMLGVARSVVEAVGAQHAGRHLALLPPGILLETVAGFFATMLAGGTYVCPPQAEAGLADPFRPDFARMTRGIAAWRITSLILVPEYLAGLVRVMEETGLRLPLLSLVAVGGARVPPPLLARARALGLPVRQGYGLTECGSVVSLEDASGDAPGSAGRPLGHMRARIAPDGEILLEGPLYLGTLDEPRGHGPLATGDIGRIDESGRLWIEGRKSNLIVTSFGRNVSPEWVEAALLAQDGIAQAMVHGDGLPAPEALIAPARTDADLAAAVAAANACLPAYARIARWREVAHFTPANGLLTGNGRLRREAITAAWLDREPAFFTELEAATTRARMAFLAIPQVQAGLAGAISREMYLRYLAQAWHHVRHTVPLMQAARARLAHRPELVAALDDYIAEETGHDEWILADIAAAGGDAASVRLSAPAPATRAMIDHAYGRIRAGNPAAFFGMVYVLESVSVALAQRGAAAVAKNLGLPAEAFTYLTSHGALDQEHMRFFADLVNGLPDPDDRAAITAMAREMFALFGKVFAGIAMEQAHALA
ncbi:AMP-binding protein [Novosphingobium album (ex Liu et al. 2023)]|uniref:AMP-binding protein n=1 Tax=Novosphingobium album (ex Liu et al. 2023) TaxID=3031130 RepID=A0ABT5WVN8_9SPHN|nr:AMP-binding protein [Novosphingobium album (ex Liu et al. 2023)]MDE8653917.1 AMP-binding protein [Novosphingobium album (ex Liu et al. 2023)]